MAGVARKERYTSAAACGAKLAEIRKAQGWTLRDIADKTGFSPQQIFLVEKGEINTPVETLARITQALAVPMAALFEPCAPAIPSDTPRFKEVLTRLTVLAEEIAHLQALFHSANPHPQKGHKSISPSFFDSSYQKDLILVPKWHVV